MTLENAKVLYKSLIEVGRTKHAKQLSDRYPELLIKEKVIEKPKEVKKDGKKSKR